jgi:hypothetical protein
LGAGLCWRFSNFRFGGAETGSQRELNQAAPYAVSNKLTVRDVKLTIAFGLVPRVLDKEPVQDAPSIRKRERFWRIPI